MRSQARTQRILCLWFPDWPIQRLVAAKPELARRLLLIAEPTKRGEFVRYRGRFAQKRGIRVGMPVSEARTLARSRDLLVVETVQPAEDAKALVELALRCEQYSFCIGLEETDPPECILMDVTGVAHFFAGEQSLAERFERELFEQRFEGRIAIAETIGLAWAAAHFLAAPRRPVVIPTGRLGLSDSLPVAGLRLDDATVATLDRLGVKTIGQLLALDRASLPTRLGSKTLLRLDQLTGQQAELITPCRPVPRYQVRRRLEEAITHPESIERLWSLLLRQLLDLLQPKRLGVRHLEGQFHLENRTSHTLTLRLCEATNNARHLADLLRFKLERLRWEAPLLGLHLEALEVAPLEASQQECFAGGSRDHTHQFLTMLNRLSSRLGEKAVVAPRLLPDPIPERAAQFLSVIDQAAPTATTFTERFRLLDRPTILFPEPRSIEVIAVMPEGPPAALFWKGTRFDIACHWGPERIESGWWQDAYICRDYYRIETTSGQWLWIFRRRQDGRWFWHGEL